MLPHVPAIPDAGAPVPKGRAMHVLLTGSSGWLGRFLAPRLRALGHRVTGLDVAPGPETDLVGSVADRGTVSRAFDRGIEAVIHAGALHKPDIVRYPAQAFIDCNVTGTLNLLEAAVSAGNDRFVFTSTTSLMISQAIRDEAGDAAIWLNETSGPLAPRNIYGVTKLAAEGLCRLYAAEYGLACVVLRTARFFPEEDDTHRVLSGENLKANEFLNRRLTVEDAAEGHVAALLRAPEIGFFTPEEAGRCRPASAGSTIRVAPRRCSASAAGPDSPRFWRRCGTGAPCPSRTTRPTCLRKRSGWNATPSAADAPAPQATNIPAIAALVRFARVPARIARSP